jgi:flagellar biosynthesis regulator FlaF
MIRGSATAATGATQAHAEPGFGDLRRWMLADLEHLRSVTASNDDRIRALLTQHLPHGSKKLIALVLWGDEHKQDRVSKELNAEEHLRADVIGVALWLLRQAGLFEIADRIGALLDHSRVMEIRTRISIDEDGSLRVEVA